MDNQRTVGGVTPGSFIIGNQHPLSEEQHSLRSNSKTESAYEDDFESISKSHLSASRQNSRSGGGGVRTSHTHSNTIDATTGAGRDSLGGFGSGLDLVDPNIVAPAKKSG